MSLEAGGPAAARASPVRFPFAQFTRKRIHFNFGGFLQLADKTSFQKYQFLWFPCGILRGALAAMDVEASVTADIPALPAAIFQITTTPPTAAAAVQSGGTPKV